MTVNAVDERRKQGLRIVAISFATLFFELALIRFINSTVQVIAYFNNFLLLSAFLGIGLGCILAARSRADWFRFFPAVLAVTVAIMVLLDGFGFQTASTQQIVWTASGPGGKNLPVIPTVLLVFGCNFAVFVCLGAELGRALQGVDDKVLAYGYDLFGSFLGVVAFGLTSYFKTSPLVWFAAGAVVVLWLMVPRGRIVVGISTLLLAVAVILPLRTQNGIWSPYYKVTSSPYRAPDGTYLGFAIAVDKLRIQDALHFSPALLQSPLAPWVPYYRLPYRFAHPGSVLILGGGSGNDATVALAEGARRVTVVEIDPVIVEAGFTKHPHRPYRSPRVEVVNDDARAFLRRTSGTYDLIVMNALDSHHQLPGLSTLRLESYIYTTEAFRDVRKRMAPDSVFVVHMSSERLWIAERLYWSLTDAFGREPALFTTEGSPFNSVAFVYAPRHRIDAVIRARGSVIPVDPSIVHSRPDPLRATDDWPQLYLRSREIPTIYLVVLALILAVTGAAFWRVGRLRTRSDVHFFLLGAGFMLLETRSITKASLLFGLTWIVNAIVISGILAVIFIGNFLVLRGVRMSRRVSYAALFVTLLIGFAVPINWILDYALPVRIILAALWLAAPIFFTSLIFSEAFGRTSDATTAFGANMLGVVVGGVLEYSSMITGLNDLYLIALALYAAAALADRAFARRPGLVPSEG